MVGETRKPLRPYSIAFPKGLANGSLPPFACSSTQAETQPGTLTESQPRSGTRPYFSKVSGVHAAGERPEALRPCSFFPSQTIAYASEPMPFDTGSTSVSVIAVARTASTALPPAASIFSPAVAAKGFEVETTVAQSSGLRGQA